MLTTNILSQLCPVFHKYDLLHKAKLIKGPLQIYLFFDYWIKNVFSLPGILVALSLYPQSIDFGLIYNISPKRTKDISYVDVMGLRKHQKSYGEKNP